MNLKMVTDKKLWSVYVFPLWELLRLVFVCSCSAGSCDLFNNQRSLLGGFPGGASDRESTYQCRRSKRPVFTPWVRKIPWSRKWQPTPVFLPGKFHGQRSLWATVHGVPKSQTRLNEHRREWTGRDLLNSAKEGGSFLLVVLTYPHFIPSQRKAMPKNDQTTTQLHSSHTLVK